MKSHSWALFEKISYVVISFFVLCYQNMYTLYQDVSFDTPFPVTLYKNVLDESMDLCGDLHVLLHECKDVHSSAMDSIVGRIVRLFSRMQELSVHQQTTNAYRQEDGAYLVTILEHMHALYQNLEQQKQYPLIVPLFDQMRDRLTQAFAL